MIVWFTGQPGSGKTTLAKELFYTHITEQVVDEDDLRNLFQLYDYGEKTYINTARIVDRAQNIALWLHSKNYNVSVALVAPYIAQREQFKELVGRKNFREIYLYHEGNFVKHYQPPEEDFLALDTEKLSVEECVKLIIEYIKTGP